MKYPESLLQKVDALLSVELAAVQQHFIHVLLLQSWNENEFAKGIIQIDELDLPNAMRLVEWMVQMDCLPGIFEADHKYSSPLPNPGHDLASILKSECDIEILLLDALTTLQQDERFSDYQSLAFICTELEQAREKAKSWTEQWRSENFVSKDESQSISGIECDSLNAYFTCLLNAINQELIHSFVHRNNGNSSFANTSWALSSGAMMQAADLTSFLGGKGMAPEPLQGMNTMHAEIPKVSLEQEHAVNCFHKLITECLFYVRKAQTSNEDEDLSEILKTGENYFIGWSKWSQGDRFPKIKNPCLDFERVYDQFVDVSSVGHAQVS